MEIPTVSACIAKIGETISRLPVKLYRKDGEEVTEITDDHRIPLLNGETGDTLSTVDMWKAVTEDYFLGSGGWKVRGKVDKSGDSGIIESKLRQHRTEIVVLP